MKKNDINLLLNSLLGEEEAPKQPEAPEQPEVKSMASEKSRQRVEEITRNVEIAKSQNRPAPQKRVEQTIPKREPVTVPPPVSHFSDEPSQNPAVRMRDRLDETALPMLDAERKPNQIIPPKPRPEQKKKKKKRPQTAKNTPSTDIPAPHSANPPKRRIPHIVVPDELPPDIPRDTSLADEMRRQREMQPEEPPMSAPRPVAAAREQEVNRKAEMIKQRIRFSMEQNEMPEPAPVPEPAPMPEPEPAPIPEPAPKPVEDDTAAEISRKAELIRQRIRQQAVQRELAAEVQEAAPTADVPEEPEVAEEVPKIKENPKKSGLFKKNQKAKKAAAQKAEDAESVESAQAEKAPAPLPEPVEEIQEVEEKAPEIEEIPEPVEEPAPRATRLRHLSAVDEPKEKAGLFGRRGNKKKEPLNNPAPSRKKPEKTVTKEQEKSEISVFFEEPKEKPAPQTAPPKWERSAVQEMPEESRKWAKSEVRPEISAPVPKPETPAPAPKPEKPAPAPKPEKPVPAPKPENPVPAPKPEKPAPAPKPEKPAPAPKPETPAPAPKPEKPAPAPKPEKPVPAPKPEKPVPAQKLEKPVPAPKPEKPVPAQKLEKPVITSEIPVAEKKAEEASIHIALPQEKHKSRFAGAIRAALDENVQTLADEKAEPVPEKSEIDVALGESKYFRRRTYFMAGIICSAFALVGIAVCVMQAVHLVRSFTSSSSLKQKLEDVLYPVAVVDLPEFEQPSDAAPETLMSAAMVDLLMYSDLSAYPKSFDMFTIPAADVAARVESMFGVKPENAYVTLYSAGEMFYYDETTGCYNVPASPVIFSYAPDISEIRRAEDVYTVTVNYCSDTAQWQQHSKNFDAIAEKTMEITVEQVGEDYRIVQIRNISKQSSGL